MRTVTPFADAASIALFKIRRESASKGVPSGCLTLQNIRMTFPWEVRHGRTFIVEGMGKSIRSDFPSSPKPRIADASNEIPSEKALSSSFGRIEIFFCLPATSQKASLMNLTSSWLTKSKTSLAVQIITGLPSYLILRHEKNQQKQDVYRSETCLLSANILVYKCIILIKDIVVNRFR